MNYKMIFKVLFPINGQTSPIGHPVETVHELNVRCDPIHVRSAFLKIFTP